MKKNILLVSAFFLTISAFAQDDVYKTIAKETCDCIAKKNYDYNTVNKQEVEMALGLCMLESAQKNNLELDMGDTETMTKLGQKVGLLMAAVCPAVFQVFAKKNTEAVEEIVEEEDDIEYFSATGKVKAIEEKDFVYIILKEDTGKEHKFIWLYYFSGSDDFKNDPKKLIGKNITITYTQLEVFQPKTKVYYNLSIPSSLELH